MFKGYKLSEIDFEENHEHFYLVGSQLFQNHTNHVQNSLDSFFFQDKSLDGSKIISSWFPQISAHVFISHSHKDASIVVALAGWLFETFGIISFIDSCIWGYGNDLIEMLDSKYSWLNESQRIYYYEKVLDSTGHVHMMLSTALNSMIDKTECLIFYDTPNAVKSFENIDKTESPWIYSEIAFSQSVRITIPKRIAKMVSETKYMSADGTDHFEKGLTIKYDINSKHLKEITATHLNRWDEICKTKSPEKALDVFYEYTFPILNLKE